MKNFWKIVNQVIKDSNIIIEVLDARMIEETRNHEIEKKILAKGKKLIMVANKADLISKEKYLSLKKTYPNMLFFSSKQRLSTTKLLKRLIKDAKGMQSLVGVVGYPNVGKSSLINALKGKNAAPTSSISGYTKALQKIRIAKRIYLFDTPGVFPRKENDEFQNVLSGAISAEKVKDPEMIAIKMIEMLEGKIEKHYGVEKTLDAEKTLENIAIKRGKLLKGGVPDTKTAAMQIIKEWQKGKIK